MTHFIGAVLVPPHIEFETSTSRTQYPDLYGKDAKEWTAGAALNDYLNEALAKFDESLTVERWVSKADTIKAAREYIEEYRAGTYARYIADPKAYSEGVSNEAHLAYLRDEFPKRLQWTDEEVYADAIKHEEPGDVREDGAVRHTYNPESKWDWWTIGGRWEQTYRERQGEKISALREELERTLVNMRDPEAQAELAAVEAEIQKAQEQFNEQRAIVKAWHDANPDKSASTYEENAALAGIDPEQILSWKDIDAIEAKRLECRAYMPWWFPYNIVVPPKDEAADFEWITKGRMGWWGMKSDEHTDEQWVETLMTVLDGFDAESRLVYIDFHI